MNGGQLRYLQGSRYLQFTYSLINTVMVHTRFLVPLLPASRVSRNSMWYGAKNGHGVVLLYTRDMDLLSVSVCTIFRLQAFKPWM